MPWDWSPYEMLAIGSAAVIILVPLVVLFVNHTVQTHALPRNYTSATLVLYTYFLEMPVMACLEAGVLGTLREQHLIAERIPLWVIMLNIGFICSGVLAVVVGLISDGRRWARRQQLEQHGSDFEHRES